MDANAKRRLDMARTLPTASLPLVGHLLRSSTRACDDLLRDPSASLLDRKIAVFVLELVQCGDWMATEVLFDRVIAHNGGQDAA